MSVFGKIADMVSGGALGSIVSLVQGFFPPGMSEEDKSKALEEARAMDHKREMDLLAVAHNADIEFNQRIKDMEGTASDLKSVRVLGPIVIFLRGVQRPAWGFGTMYGDFMIYSGGWGVKLTNVMDGSWTPEGVALVAINLLVLGFLFGERAVKNLLPLVMQFMGRKASMLGAMPDNATSRELAAKYGSAK